MISRLLIASGMRQERKYRPERLRLIDSNGKESKAFQRNNNHYHKRVLHEDGKVAIAECKGLHCRCYNPLVNAGKPIYFHQLPSIYRDKTSKTYLEQTEELMDRRKWEDGSASVFDKINSEVKPALCGDFNLSYEVREQVEMIIYRYAVELEKLYEQYHSIVWSKKEWIEKIQSEKDIFERDVARALHGHKGTALKAVLGLGSALLGFYFSGGIDLALNLAEASSSTIVSVAAATLASGALGGWAVPKLGFAELKGFGFFARDRVVSECGELINNLYSPKMRV